MHIISVIRGTNDRAINNSKMDVRPLANIITSVDVGSIFPLSGL